MIAPEISIRYPDWVDGHVDWDRCYESDADRMRLAIDLSRQNVLRETGGPFGAAVFETETGRLVSVGMNLVVPLNNCMLHAEAVALMMAGSRVASYSLDEGVRHELVTSCAPCAMCLGAALWSGVRRIVCGARSADAERIGFDEGPVFTASHEYLSSRGIRIEHHVLRADACAVLDLYASRSGRIYNGLAHQAATPA
ncbi:MAG TPA: nucleoside deaminase [Longimicrobiaceae bacterium]|nr:nucleoside deaminase [Longimicrobiaceae bacterium]